MAIQTTVLRHPDQGKIFAKIDRPPAAVVEAFRGFYTGIVSDTLGKLGPMHHEIKPVAPGMKLCGPAVTCLGTDQTVRKLAMGIAEPGDVVVVAAGGVKEYACFGDMSATFLHARGVAGIVIDGATRDVAGIKQLGFPTFARAVTPRNYHYPAGGDHGAINVSVVCGGMLVNPGDIILGDDDGVIVVSKDVAEELARAVRSRLDVENHGRQVLLSGRGGFDVTEELKGRGYEFL